MRRLFVCLAFAAAMSATSSAPGDIVMGVFASPAPNFFSSPSWSGYLANANNSLENGLGDIGDRNTDPTAYEIFDDGSTVQASELVVSNFDSWRGTANPASPFDQEGGNRVHFGLHIVGDGLMRFRLEDLSYGISSTEGNTLGFSGSFAGSVYSSTRIGIDYGADMMKGGGDDLIITSGSSTQFIDEFIYVGVGNAFDASFETGPSDQEKLDQAISSIQQNTPFDVIGSYTLTDSTGNITLASGSTSFTVVPEPGTGILLTVMLGSASLFYRKRSRVVS